MSHGLEKYIWELLHHGERKADKAKSYGQTENKGRKKMGIYLRK
jgi:hypothetical protein